MAHTPLPHSQRRADACVVRRHPARGQRPDGGTVNANDVIGPRTQARKTCEGCPALRKKEWRDYLENDETDSGTDAECFAMHGRSISVYFSPHTTPVPAWCPADAMDAAARSPDAHGARGAE